MAVASFCPGQALELDGKRYVLDRLVDEHTWQLECMGTGRYRTELREDLLALYADRRLRFIVPAPAHAKCGSAPSGKERQIAALDLLPSRIQAATKTRYAYVMAVKKARPSHLTRAALAPIIQEVWSKLHAPPRPPHWTTVFRWYKRFSAAGEDVRALVDRDIKKGNKTLRYPESVVEIVRQAVSSVYLTRESPTMEDTLAHAKALVLRENRLRPVDDPLPLPTRSLIRAAINAIPAFDRALAREGRDAATRRFRKVLQNMITTAPLERTEIDHTKANVMVIDDETSLPLGRPWVTACLDIKTRCVLGVHVGFEPPSFASVSQCLRHALLPKSHLHEQFPSIKHDWEPYGRMQTLVVDNGLEFHGSGLEALCYSLGITVLYAPRKKSWFKGSIERFLGTLNRKISHGVPGTTFANIFERGDYDATKHAVIKLSTFREMLHKWIVDVYHFEVHKTLGRPPITEWKENIERIDLFLPADVDDLDALLGDIVERTVSHKGIEFDCLQYNSKELQELRRRYGDTFKAPVRYNPMDLSCVYVIDPETNRPVCAPALRSDYASGLTKYQHAICKRYSRERLDRGDIEALIEAKEDIRELIARDFSDKRTKTRSRAKRFLGSGSVSNGTAAPGSPQQYDAPTGRLIQPPSPTPEPAAVRGESEEFDESEQTMRLPRPLPLLSDG